MDSSTSSDAVLPRRNSAKTASAAITNQLDSASEDSGAEPVVASAQNGRANVKRTYGRKGGRRERAASVKEDVLKPKSNLKKPKNRSPSLPPSVPQTRAATTVELPTAPLSSKEPSKSRSSVKKTRARSPSLPLFVPPTRTPTQEPVASTSSHKLPEPKAGNKNAKAGSQSRSIPPPRPRSTATPPVHQIHEPSRSTTHPQPISRKIPISKKAGIPHMSTPAPELDDDELSELTSLSSHESARATSPDIIIIDQDEQHSFPSHSASRPAHVGSSSEQSRRKDSSWSLENLDGYVWVLIEPTNAQVYNPDGGKDDDTERLWWPGKIKSPRVTDVPLKIKLFGTGMKTVELRRPCQQNILSKLDSLSRWRFRTPAFVSPSSLQDGIASLKKKPKLDRGDIERKWNVAVNEMKMACDEDEGSDYFPDVGEFLSGPLASSHTTVALSPQPTFNAVMKGKRKRDSVSDRDVDDDMVIREDDLWEPPPPEFGLEIPGELVLARDQPAATVDYWPAMITAYVPPTTRKQQGKYHVTWLDTTTGDIPRAWFYTTEQDEFATCKLGQFVSHFQEVQNDDEDEQDDLRHLTRRSPSPIPLEPPPSLQEFIKLPIRAQFVYTRPVLQAILNKEYQPVVNKHDMFMRGGKERQNVLEAAALRGKMDPKDVEYLQEYVREWCLREHDAGRPPTAIADLVSTGNTAALTVTEDNTMTVVQDAQATGIDLNALPANDDMQSDAGASRVTSPPTTEPLPSSPPEMPPSSYPSTSSRLEPEDSFDVPVHVHSLVPDSSQASICSEGASVAATEPLTTTDALTDRMSDFTSVAQEREDVEIVESPRRRWCNDFESLDPKLKVEYCLNILGPESIRQILLWRTGARTSFELLSVEEEQELYNKGETLLQERDWVFDIMRVRERLGKNLAQKTVEGTGRRRTGGSSRPRRTTAAVNYQE
ncbi:unnamed protein product [Cyclocybe aegerita]|uniref:Uncharacterized protein n=1 Tax=Cyclocybe aegerita TaxID=1973307 RepID=A0A8S0X1G3_CYCAE|nr:unnamed protein product [Cyclocybe aegerita]